MIDTLAQIRWLVSEGQALLAHSDLTPSRNLESWQRSMLQQQVAFRKRSTKRFPVPEKWLWTEKSLAQASDWWSAKFKASLIPQAVDVVDICCGAGVDAAALASGRSLTAVDTDPIMLELAKSNAANHNCEVRTRQELVTHRSLLDQPWIHIDPDRRPEATRTITADCFSPSLTDVLALARDRVGAIIKLAPTTVFAPALEEEIQSEYQRCWIGNFGETRQQLLIRGGSRLSHHGRRVACLLEPHWSNDRQEWDEQLMVHTFSCTEDRTTEWPEASEVKSYMYDLHSVLHSSRLAFDFGKRFGLAPLTSENGYYTSDRLCLNSWVQSFRVLDVLPWDDRQIRKWLGKSKAGIVEIKNRLMTLSANEFQRRYSREQGRPVTLLVTKIGGRVRAIAAERVSDVAEMELLSDSADAERSCMVTFSL